MRHADRITDPTAETARLLRLLAVDGQARTSQMTGWTALTLRQVHNLLRKSGRATVERQRYRYQSSILPDDNDYLWKLRPAA